MKKKLQKLIVDRRSALLKAENLVNKADAENRDLNPEESTQWDGHMAEVAKIDLQIANTKKMIEAQDAQNAFENSSEDRRLVAGFHTGEETDGVGNQNRKDLNKFSFIKAISAALPNGRLEGVEKEMHEEAQREARVSGRAINGIGIPQVILSSSGRSNFSTDRYRNAQSATGGTGGSEGGMLINTDLRPMIDFLRESLVFSRLGVNMMGGLIGDVQFPRVIRGTRPTHKSERATADQYSVTFGSTKLSPKRLPVQLLINKQLLIQTSGDVENKLREILGFELASAMEYMSLFGTGSGSEPLGVINTSGIGLASLGTNGAAPTRAMVLELEGYVDDANAAMGSLAFLTNTKVKRTLKQVRLDSSNTDSQYVWPKSGDEVEGHPGILTNNVPSNLTKGSGTNLSPLFYANWRGLMIGQWGGLDIIMDQFTGAAEGDIKLTMATYSDSAVEHVESFAVCKDIVTT